MTLISTRRVATRERPNLDSERSGELTGSTVLLIFPLSIFFARTDRATD